MIGFIKLHRKFLDHWLYQSDEPFTEREAWIDILMNVNWEDKKMRIGNDFIVCKAGQCYYSQLTWAKRWRWNRSRVQRFINLLEKDNMIEIKIDHKTSRLTVCNWSSYQEKRADNEHIMSTKRAHNEHIVSTTKEGKEDKEVYNTHTTQKNFLENSNLFRKPTIPTLEKVKEVFAMNGGTEEMANNFYETMESTEWFYKGSPVKNFSSLVPKYINAWKQNELKNISHGTNKTSRERQNAASAAVSNDLKKAIEFINRGKTDNSDEIRA